MEETELDEDWYCRKYPDVRQAMALGYFRSALEHYKQFGMIEGRQTHPRKPRIIIHIGPHKTATTYIQENLALARNHLAAQGVAYPAAWSRQDGSATHQTFVEQLVSGQGDIIRNELDQLVDHGYSAVIVSSENLCLLPTNHIETLSEIFSSHQVDIVYYLRPWSDRLMSVWKESVRHGGTDTFLAFINRHLANPKGSDVINLYKHLKRYAGVFGRKAIILASYDSILSNGFDLFDHFLKAIVGIEVVRTALIGKHLHRSASVLDAEIARALNALSSAHLPTGGSMGLYFLDNMHRFEAEDIREVMERHETVVALDNRVRPFSVFDEKTYRRFAANMIDPRPREYLFDSCGTDQLYVSPDYLLNIKLRERIGEILEDVLKHSNTPSHV